MKYSQNYDLMIKNGIEDKIRYVFDLINYETTQELLFLDYDTYIEVNEFYLLMKKEISNFKNQHKDIEIINNALMRILEIIEINKFYYNELY